MEGMVNFKNFKMSNSVQSAVEHLKKKEGFDFKDFLGKGTYGTVFKISNQQRGVMAAKIVENKVVNLMEIREWAKFDHENILRLLDTIYSVDGVVIFLTTLMDTNLFHRLQNKEFKKECKAPEKCRSYARQVLSGLAYLHQLQVCHLDLRAENVFLTLDDKAVVADFSGLCRASDLKKFCPLPHSLRPPEMLGTKKKVSPIPIDLWAYGLLLVNIFLGKGFYLCTVKHPRCGTPEAVIEYKELFQCQTYVEKFIDQTYPNSRVSDIRIRELISLVNLFLQLDPELRVSAEIALRHNFLTIPAPEPSSSVSSNISGPSTSGAQTTLESSSESEVCTIVNSENGNLQPAYDEGDKKSKKTKWQKYKTKFGKLSLILNSPPDKSKQQDKPKNRKNNSYRALFAK